MCTVLPARDMVKRKEWIPVSLYNRFF